MIKRTKIVCTLGPAVDDEEVLRQLLLEGMDVARLNFSHGTHEEQAERMGRVRRLSEELGRPCAIMLDTKGPEIRTSAAMPAEGVTLAAGDVLALVPEGEPGAAEAFGVPAIPQTCGHLARHLKPGAVILVDDGLVELRVESVSSPVVLCRAQNGGVIRLRKSINVPGVEVPLPAITEEDEADLLFGIERGVDYVAASFVRDAEHVRTIRRFLQEHGGRPIGLIAKIENASAVRNIEEVLAEADGIMVARGDLGVEVPPHEVPCIQKEIIRACNRARKPVITATQMLDSMTLNPRPTRAEAADVANAIYDGTDCVMLSGETAVGKYPVETVRMMAQIAVSSEGHLFKTGRFRRVREAVDTTLVSLAVGTAAVQTAESIGASCIVCPTMTGRTARLISSFRSEVPIYSVTPSPAVLRSMQLYWGVLPMLGDVVGDMHEVMASARDVVRAHGLVEPGNVAVFTSGDPATSPKSASDPSTYAPTNVLQVVEIR